MGEEVEWVGVIDGRLDEANFEFTLVEFVGLVVVIKQVLQREPSGQY